MAEIKYFLAFDCGATSGRGVLASFSPDGFSMEEVYRFPSEMVKKDGRMQWDVVAMHHHFVTCLKQIGEKGIQLESIGIDTWGVDFGHIGPDGELLGLPRCYRDPYTNGIPEKVFQIVPREQLYARTGIQIMNFNTIFQLYAQTQAQDKALQDAASILFMPDLLSYLLTGKKVCEYTDASTSGMMDQATRQFNKPLLEELGVCTDMLLPIVPSGTVVGPLKPEIAKETGLGPVPVVAVAGHDTASAIAAVPAADEHFAYLSSGTWSLMGVEVPAPIINEASARENFTNEGGIEGTTRFLKNITGMWLLEQCRKVWAKEGRTYTYPQIADMARAAIAFPSRINPDDPRFANPADMVAELKAACAESGQPQPATDGEMVSLIYHSLACRYKEMMQALQDFAPFKIDKLHVIGGGSANDLMSQLTADTIGLPVVAGPVEATAIGNLMMQARAAGLVKDRWEMRAIVAKAFSVKEFQPKNN